MQKWPVWFLTYRFTGGFRVRLLERDDAIRALR
jgi:hypothetical protein